MPPGASDLYAVRPIRERQETTPFDGILEQSRDLICDRLDEAIAGMLDRAGEALSALIKETQNRDDRCLYEETKEVAIKQRDTIEEQFQEAYLDDFQRRSDRARRIGQAFDEANSDYSMDALELVGEDDLEETLKCNDMAAKLRAYCDEELVALNQRVGVLLGDADLQANDNPFSPQVVCDAYKHACRQLDADTRVRRVLLKLFDDHVLDDIRSVYKAVNALLVRNSILPKIRYSVTGQQDRKSSAPGAPAAGGVAPLGMPGTDLTASAGQDLFSILQNLVANSVGAMGVGAGTGAAGAHAGVGSGAAIMQGAELLGSLTRIQRGDLSAVAGGSLVASAGIAGATNVLRELKGTSVGAGMGQLDLLTLDIIAMLFDQLFDDPKVPNGVKGLIGRLQIPMLKVAIADKSFFSTKNHPARRLLDAIGEIALRLPADFSNSSPLFERLQGVLQELVDGFQDDLEIFTRVREQLHGLLSEEDRRIEEETQAATKHVEEMENLALAKSVAQEEVKARVQAHKLPGLVTEFLAQQWLKLLLLIHVREGKESQAWKEALESMDQLIWSIEPKGTFEERRQLAAMLPGLIKQLAAGLASAGIEDDVRVQFFTELMKHHTQAISAPLQGNPDSSPSPQGVPSQVESTTAARLEAALGAVVKPAASDTLDFTAPITVKNPFGEGEVSVDSQDLDFTVEAAKGARAKREASITRALDNLRMGTWVEFHEPGEKAKRRPARLIFVSPRKTRYLFAVDRAGKEVIQCTRAEIGRRLRIGEAVKLDDPPEESLFERIMGGVLGKLRTAGRAGLFPLVTQ